MFLRTIARASLVSGQVMRQRAAAAGAGHAQRRDPDPVEDACGGGVDVRLQPRLHAAFHHQHLACVPRRGPCASAFAARDAVGDLARQPASDGATHRQGAAEKGWRQQCAAQRPALRSLGGRTSHFGFDQRAPDVDQPAVLDSRGAGRLAVAAGEAAIEVLLRRRGDCAAFEHFLDEIDAAARSVQLVAQQLIRRARGVAKAAVNARAQDGVGFAAVARVAVFRR
jgi:hypothetical protein